MLTQGALSCRMKFSGGARLKSILRRGDLQSREVRRESPDGVRYLLFAEEISAHGLRHEARVFQLEVGALDFAAVYGELGGERGGRGERVARGELVVADARLDLLADLQAVG